MAGYSGYSMSNNAVSAYESGERPMSKWTKQDIIDEILKVNPNLDEPLLRKVKVSTLKVRALRRTSWHHTSSRFNRTDFYSIDDEVVNWTNEDIKEMAAIKEEKKEEPKEQKAVCEYLVWTGTRKHPKATVCESEGIIKGNWFYLPDGTKKSVNAKGFKILRKI